jgi:hypothetical protein
MSGDGDVSKADAKELRTFGLVLGALFAAPSASFRSCVIARLRYGPGFLPAILWLMALIWPASLSYLHRVWTRLGLALGWVNTRVILTLLFTLTIVPVGLVMRLFGRDRMARKLDPEGATATASLRAAAPTRTWSVHSNVRHA